MPTTHLDMDIAQMQDELVNNPNMSEQKKWGIEDKITKLSADRDVLNWRRSRTTPPSVEDFEAKKGYIEQQKQFNQDAIVNGLGNGTLKVGSDEWYALQKKGDKLQEQIDAYNRGMMGVLDGDKAVPKSEQETTGTTKSNGYRGNVSLSANNDAPMYAGLDDEEQQLVFNSQNPPCEEERLKLKIEDTFASIQGMSDEEKVGFIQSAEGEVYQKSLADLKDLLNPFEYENYINELYGDGNANNSNNPILDHIFDDTLLSIAQDNTTSMTGELEESLKGLVDAPGYDNDVDDSEATEIVIDFTNPAYEQLREQYSFWKDGHTIAKDLADYIMVNYPVIAKNGAVID